MLSQIGIISCFFRYPSIGGAYSSTHRSVVTESCASYGDRFASALILIFTAYPRALRTITAASTVAPVRASIS